MSNIYSSGIGGSVQGVSIDNTRRVYNFGDRIAELAPLESPFFVYLSKVAKSATDDPIFKFLEQRHQWQRRNFEVQADSAAASISSGSKTTLTGVQLTVKYDKYGREVTADTAPEFLIKGQVITLKGVRDLDGAGAGTTTETSKVTARITNVGTPTASYVPVDVTVEAIGGDTAYDSTYNGQTLQFKDGDPGQVTGSAFAEATGAPEGWKDDLYNREGYCQIFKTAIPLFSGTTLATRFRGIANEYNRVWAEKLKEHKMDIEHAMLFGVGRYAGAEDGTTPKRFTWGIAPYTEKYGQTFNFAYATSTYDDFVDAMRDFYAPESGNSRDKLVLTSRKVLAWLQKLAGDGFLKNTVTSNSYRLDVQNIQGGFGHEVTRVRTIFGNLHFVEEPLLRGLYEDYALAIDMKNVKYRPLVGNGISRDTHVVTNVQNNDTDGRKDMILTEAGLEISLPETHAVMKWS